MKVHMTCYWLVDVADESSWTEYRRPSTDEDELACGHLLPSAFLRAVRMEGCGITPFGMLSYAGVGKYILDESVAHPWGDDALGGGLIPFTSIAIDRKFLKMGSQYHVCQLLGRIMPNGTVHSGIVHAVDCGGGIVGDKIDFFVGSKSNWKGMLAWLPEFVDIEEVVHS